FSGSEYTPMWVRQRTWEAHPAAVAQTRDLTWAALADWNLIELTDPAMLCVSELATNAILHAVIPSGRVSWLGRTFTVRLLFWPKRAVAIEVQDHDPRPPRVPDRRVMKPSLSAPDEIGDSSRGLRLVEACSDFLMWNPTAMGGKAVWCRFDLEPRKLARPFLMNGNP
ncbi:ATP-binding protein, partial [Streptomyces sp. SID3343]|uniref:ATP-binding protein n=1 Tax=Streptomyces sp. SID3343 TaxID=2690260 RepID=UPI0031F8200D